jgi:hypothetical protein
MVFTRAVKGKSRVLLPLLILIVILILISLPFPSVFPLIRENKAKPRPTLII